MQQIISLQLIEFIQNQVVCNNIYGTIFQIRLSNPSTSQVRNYQFKNNFKKITHSFEQTNNSSCPLNLTFDIYLPSSLGTTFNVITPNGDKQIIQRSINRSYIKTNYYKNETIKGIWQFSVQYVFGQNELQSYLNITNYTFLGTSNSDCNSSKILANSTKQVSLFQQNSILFIIILAVIIPVVLFVTIMIVCIYCNPCKKKVQNPDQSNNNIPSSQNALNIQTFDHQKMQNSQCSICLQNKCDSYLKCGHFFHFICLKDWFLKSKVCPLCRKNSSKSHIIKVSNIQKENNEKI